MTLLMGVMPLAFTLIIAKATGGITEDWSAETFGVVFAAIHMALMFAGAWIYAVKIED